MVMFGINDFEIKLYGSKFPYNFKKMKYYKIPYSDGKFQYEINPYSGSLIQYNEVSESKITFPQKVEDALQICNNPYSINAQDSSSEPYQINNVLIKKINKMHNILMSIGNKRYFISLLYSRIKNSLFINTKIAFDVISQNIPDQIDRRNELCLQRSLLAMKISRSFKNSGVLFIGASLPTGNMHAWIIESGCNPDSKDREWIMYRPLIAYCY